MADISEKKNLTGNVFDVDKILSNRTQLPFKKNSHHLVKNKNNNDLSIKPHIVSKITLSEVIEELDKKGIVLNKEKHKVFVENLEKQKPPVENLEKQKPPVENLEKQKPPVENLGKPSGYKFQFEVDKTQSQPTIDQLRQLRVAKFEKNKVVTQQPNNVTKPNNIIKPNTVEKKLAEDERDFRNNMWFY